MILFSLSQDCTICFKRSHTIKRFSVNFRDSPPHRQSIFGIQSLKLTSCMCISKLVTVCKALSFNHHHTCPRILTLISVIGFNQSKDTLNIIQYCPLYTNSVQIFLKNHTLLKKIIFYI